MKTHYPNWCPLTSIHSKSPYLYFQRALNTQARFLMMLIMDVHGTFFGNSDVVERVSQSVLFQHVSSRFGRASWHNFDHIVFLHVIICPIHKRSSLYLYCNGIMIMYWPNTVEHHPSCGHGHIFDGSHLDDCGSGVRQVVVVVVLQVFVVAGRETFQITAVHRPDLMTAASHLPKTCLATKT